MEAHPHLPKRLSILTLRRQRGVLISLLQHLARNRDLRRGKQLHAFITTNGFHRNSPSTITSLIHLYSSCSQPHHSLSVLRTSPNPPNLISLNATISAAASHSLPLHALSLYFHLRCDSLVPDAFTFPSVVNACGDLNRPVEVFKICGLLHKLGLEGDVFVVSAVVNCWLRLGFVGDAVKVFEGLSRRDVVMWNSVVNGLAQAGRFADAVGFYERMGREGVEMSKFTVTGVLSAYAATGDLDGGRRVHDLARRCGYDSDVCVCNSLIDMYGKCGVVEEAVRVFEGMKERDVFSWNSMISALQKGGDDEGTLALFGRMRRVGVLPDHVTVTAVLPACAHITSLKRGREIHGYMVTNGLRNEGDAFVENVVMDMYAKCGNLGDARLVFDGMRGRDAVSWNIMINSYAAHGKGLNALGLFAHMCDIGIAPDTVTFVGVLSACSHAGLVDKGKKIVEVMESDYKVAPTVEHYSCVVDMLGRAGRLEEAHNLLVSMPIGSNPVVWRAYMASCRIHGDADRAVEAAKKLVEMEPKHSGSYVLLSNLYGSTGRHEDVSDIRLFMRNQNIKKLPGCSWIELDSGVHAFVTGDKGHPETEQIYSVLDVLVGRLRECGYVPNTQSEEVRI